MEELNSDDLVIDATGEPGARTFWVQVREGDRVISVKAEKEQAAVLAERAIDMLDTIAEDVGPDPVEPTPTFALAEPIVPRFVLGAIALGYDEGDDRMIVQLEELTDAESDDTESTEGAEAGDVVRIRLSRTRLRSVAAHTLEVVEQGRPSCALCGLPKDPDHVCPRSNGHRELGSAGNGA